MNLDSLKLLQYLKDHGGLQNKISIAPLIDELVESPPDFNGYTIVLRPIYHLMATLVSDKHIEYNELPSPNGSTYTWDIVKNIRIQLTAKGDNYLKDILNKDVEIQLNKRLLESHELSQKVNKSVIDTNEQMVSISREQARTNEAIAYNSTKQTNIFNNQKWVLWTSVFVAGCSAFISYLNYHVTEANSQSTQELKKINKRIDTLERQLSQIKNEGDKNPKILLPKK